MTCTRRDVLHTIGLAGAVALVPACGGGGGEGNVPVGKGTMCGANLCLKLSENAELGPVDGILFFTAGSKKLFVRRTSATELVAVSAICTHAACTVDFNGSDKFNCPCHGSSYMVDGTVINGPAQSPLVNFPVAIAGDDVTVTL